MVVNIFVLPFLGNLVEKNGSFWHAFLNDISKAVSKRCILVWVMSSVPLMVLAVITILDYKDGLSVVKCAGHFISKK